MVDARLYRCRENACNPSCLKSILIVYRQFYSLQLILYTLFVFSDTHKALSRVIEDLASLSADGSIGLEDGGAPYTKAGLLYVLVTVYLVNWVIDMMRVRCGRWAISSVLVSWKPDLVIAIVDRSSLLMHVYLIQ